jgi:hydroxyacylglutathione hydrolase
MKTTEIPTLQNYHLEGIHHILPADALEAIQNKSAFLLDVREEHECSTESIDHGEVIYIPMSVISTQLELIPRDRSLVVMCAGGIRSARVVKFLIENGFQDIANLDGGFMMWHALELPVKYSKNEL